MIMRIAVTGAGGFIGTELLAVLNKMEDVSVIALTRDATAKQNSERCEWRGTDYSSGSLVKALEGADAVIHLAGVRGTEKDPDKFSVNMEMTGNILEAMKDLGIKRMVFASTVSVYNDDSLMPWTEDAPLKGRSCYGDSKADCEQMIKSFAQESGATYGIARIAQVVGEGEKRRGMMNVFIDTAREHGTLKVMGKSAAKKHYIYVADLVNILAILACGKCAPEMDPVHAADENIILNAGMPEAYTNLEVAKIANEVFGNPSPIDYDDSYPETGRPFVMDISRLRNVLGCEPLNMEETLIRLRDS